MSYVGHCFCFDVVAPKRAVCFVRDPIRLCSLSTDSAGQLDVLGHDGDALGVDGAQTTGLPSSVCVADLC